MCRSQDTLFTPLLPFTRPLIQAQVRSQDPHLTEKRDISPPKQTFFRKYDNFHPKKFKFDRNFRKKKKKKKKNEKKKSVQKPLFSMKSADKPPLSWQFIRSQAPKFGNPGRTYLPENRKKVSASPGTNFSIISGVPVHVLVTLG